MDAIERYHGIDASCISAPSVEKGVSRSDLESGAHIDLYRNNGMAHSVWSEARRSRSIDETLALRPKSGPLWIFGYGSLIWNPCLRYQEMLAVTLQGWSRSFCIQSVAGRGTIERPGRAMALRPGGAVQGIAFRIAEADIARELPLIWRREMITGVYQPCWLSGLTSNGEEVMTLTFKANPTHPLFIDSEPLLETAIAIKYAKGVLGTNARYLFALKDSLSKHGLSDQYVSSLTAFVESID